MNIFGGFSSTRVSFIVVLDVFVVFDEVFEEFPVVVEFSDLVIFKVTASISLFWYLMNV